MRVAPVDRTTARELAPMIGETAEALRIDPNTGTAGGEAFTWVESYCEAAAALERGWDPYEVWRTRVKLASVLRAVAQPPDRLPALK
jgi:hypothetical protein